MNFKKSKQEVVNDAVSVASAVVNSQLSSIKGGYNPVTLVDLTYAVEYAIVNGIQAAVESLIENVYTDEEFESDLSLKS